MNLITALLISLAINGLFFIIAAVLHTDVFTDITYSLSFLLLTILFFCLAETRFAVQILTALSVVVWSLRLGGYLFNRILHIKVDHRFDDKRDNVISFGSFWLLQAVTVWVVLLPVFGILSIKDMPSVSPVMLIPGAVVFLAGLALESVADAQKYRFKMKAETKGKFMSSGIWRYSRHPNYFGEMLVWWGISAPGLFLFHGLEWMYFIGPVFITVLLLFVSGIPLLEKSADSKWGRDAPYIEYKRRTSLLVPLPRKKG